MSTVLKPPYNIYVAPKGFTPYILSGMAELTEEELAWEYEVEWLKYSTQDFKNQSLYFKDFNDFVYKVLSSSLVWLNYSDLSKLERSTCTSYLHSLDIDKKLLKIKNDHGHRRDVDAIVTSIKNNTITPPIVLKTNNHEKKIYLLSGNTRMCVGAAMNLILPVKLVSI